jgi:hypothetical protein
VFRTEEEVAGHRGNLSQITDGAAALIMSEEKADQPPRPRARFVNFLTGRCDPRMMLTADPGATEKVLARDPAEINAGVRISRAGVEKELHPTWIGSSSTVSDARHPLSADASDADAAERVGGTGAAGLQTMRGGDGQRHDHRTPRLSQTGPAPPASSPPATQLARLPHPGESSVT